ncbi:MAG: DUF1963 domain-containing protein [Oscillospiraceae bacterium]|nr:DUF1963 domain-containing protein [Oscillospiraceae bacterium]
MTKLSVENDIFPRIAKELPAKECIKLSLERSDCSLWDSKVGGTPYFPRDMEYPTDEVFFVGEPLRFLAQLNFADLPHLDGFPEKGILQFFITAESDYGLPQAGTTNGGYKVIYHPDVITDEELLCSSDDIPYTDDEDFPVKDTYLITGTIDKSLPSADDFRFEDIVLDALEKASGIRLGTLVDAFNNDRDGKVVKECLGGEDALERIWEYGDAHEDRPSLIGGYPSFDQCDVRRDDLEDHTVLLFQLASVYDYDNDIMIEWGDDGVADFFITKEDLDALDFSDVLFSWDCG